MLRRKRLSGSWLAAGLTVAVITAWVALAPVQLGGPVAYVIVNGNSMEPLYQRGDLVLTYRADGYGVGDIVAYQHPKIGLIIHRIVAEVRGHFTMKGDHNTWLDSYRPDSTEVIGRAWAHLPGVGKILEQLRAPAVLASLAVLLASFVALPMIIPTLPAQPARRGGRRVRWSHKP